MKKSPIRWSLLLLVLAGLVHAQNYMCQDGTVDVKPGTTAEDVVTFGADVIIRGNVFGTVYSVESDVTLGDGAVVTGDMTLIKGALTIARNAVIKGKILVFETLIKTDLPYFVQAGTLVFKDAGFKIQSIAGTVDQRVIDYLRRYLVMPRPVPAGRETVFPDFVDRSASAEGVGSFRISSLVEFNIQREIIDRSFAFRGTCDDQIVDITAIRFDTPADSEYFWNKVRTIPEARIDHSLHISLAGGAHWFFRHRDSSVVLWYNANWLFAVEVSGRGSAEKRDALRDKIVAFYTRQYARSEP